MSRVHIIATGGTIASTADDDGATPALSGESLVEAIPDIDDYADVTVEQLCQRPGFDMDLETLVTVAEQVRTATDAVDGVVVTHGTDTMAESAYALDLALDVGPVVFTGAQRRPDELSPDGPANLRDAVRAAAHERLTDGAFLAFNGELHAARDVVKAHTSALETFTSPGTGPVASLTRSEIRWHREPEGSAVTLDGLDTAGEVPIVTSGSGVDGAQVERALAAGVDGIVVAATGLGNTTAALGEALVDAVERVPVVVASRCHAGSTDAVYGTPGGAVTLARHGVVFADDLSPWKARIGLLLAIESDIPPETVFA